MTGDDAGLGRARRAKDLFERALDLPETERAAFVARECDTEGLRDEVTDLLRREAQIGDFLEVPAAQRLLGPPDDDLRLAAGERVGPFTVVGPIGEGGGGVVYEAEQDGPRRRVALKLVRTRTGRPLAGFQGEVASLAALRHPAIAHVYAAGVLEAGDRARPWIAMELIDGARSIVRFADEERLGRDERLRLFASVCDALDHAHRRGVVHRDVTPGNVLVDAEGAPKVVDFGVACSADAAAGAAAAGTLAYASPEQLAADGAAADLRADVWGLGALLYELLAGRPPHDVERLTLAESIDAKRTPPPPPSAVPTQRATSRDAVPPDLDVVVLCALAPDPDDRYGSAAALAADVRRFVAHEPVAAYRGGTAYQVAKFVRRRRAAAAGIAATALALVAGTAVSVWFAVQSAAERDRAERRSYAAEVAAAAAALRVDDVAEARRRLDRAPRRLREWEWRHLDARLDGSAATTAFPGREIWDGAVSADGALVAIAGLDRTGPESRHFAALACGDGTIVREWRSEGRNVPTAAVSADGTRFAAGFDDGRVVLWDVAAGSEIGPVAAHAARVIDVAFDPAGARIATACADGTVRIASAADGHVLATLAGGAEPVICVAFGADGARLLTGSRDGAVRVWDAAAGVVVCTLTGHEGSVEGVSVSPGGERLASVSRDRSVRLWDAAGAALATGRAHTSNVRSVAFDPAGGTLVSASWDGTLRVWDARTGAERGTLRGHGAGVTAVGFARDEPRLVSFSLDGTVKRWVPASSDVPTLRGAGGDSSSLDFAPAGNRVAAACRDGRVRIVDAATAQATQSFAPDAGGVTVARFLDASTVILLTDRAELQVWALGSGDVAPSCARRVRLPHASYGILLIDRRTGTAWLGRYGGSSELMSIRLADGEFAGTCAVPLVVQSAAIHVTGGIAVGDREGRVACRLGGGDWVVAQPDSRVVRSVAFDATGERIVTASEGGTVRVLRSADLATLGVLAGHSGDVYQAEFLPGGRRVVSVSRDRTVRLWDADDGENVLVLAEHGYPVGCLAVSPDGTRIVTSAGTTGDVGANLKVWAAPTRR